MEWNLVAPDIDRLLGCFDRGYKNPAVQTRRVLGALDRLFEALDDLAPLTTNNEAKSIWLKVPRGSIDDFDNYEDLLDDGEVDSCEEYIALWESDYSDAYKWYELIVMKNEYCQAVSVGRVSVVCADLGREPAESDWYEEHLLALLELLARAAGESMGALRSGTYNETVANELPYFHRFGVVSRSDVWACEPESRAALFDGMDNDMFEAFCSYAAADAEDAGRISRLSSMTGNDFLSACALGYEACGYDLCGKGGKRLPLDELYLRYADGRDEGLIGKKMGLHPGSGIDLSSPEAWEEWYFDRSRSGGHPWEVCRGGNSTHVSLAVCHDRPEVEFRYRLGELSDAELQEAKKTWGYYYAVSGNAWNRSVEAVNFYVALKRAGLPIILCDARAIFARFKGEDLVGVVPHDNIPVYCERMFPKHLGTILDFMHVYDEDMADFGDKIEWLPEPMAQLTSKASES